MFGQKLRKLRREKGMSQLELARKLGYVSNSYIADIESGKFIPSELKLKKIAKALKIPFQELEELLIESKIEELGIKEKELVDLFIDIPKLPEEEKRKIIKVYLSIKEKLKKKEKS
jgi:transcriptional regulator with XRE-family HTH domain